MNFPDPAVEPALPALQADSLPLSRQAAGSYRNAFPSDMAVMMMTLIVTASV